MKTKKLNRFEKICKRCEGSEQIEINPIITARKMLKENVKSKDDLLLYKAEAKGANFYSYSALMMSLGALIMTCISMLIQIMELPKYINIIYACIVFPYIIYLMFNVIGYGYVGKWKKYILIVIEELEVEIENGTFLNEESSDSKTNNKKKHKKKK